MARPARTDAGVQRRPPRLYGAGAAGIDALLPAKEMLIYISIIVAIADPSCFSNAVMRNLTWPGVAAGLLALAAVSIGGIYPWAVQTFEVKPTLPLQKEAPGHRGEHPRYAHAFGLEDTKITPYRGTGKQHAAGGDARGRDAPLASIRLLDPEILPATYTQLQQVRGFYGFGEKLDVVRYERGKTARWSTTWSAPRQIDYSPNGLTEQQQQWQNRHSYYSHGYGIVGAPCPVRSSATVGRSSSSGSLGETSS